MKLALNPESLKALNPGQWFRFASVDLAPNDQLESGFSALDRDRQLVRVDKLYKDKEIIDAVLHLGPAKGTVLLIDNPKSLSIPNRWQQEQIKMHPFRLYRDEGRPKADRFEQRGRNLYEALAKHGVMTFLYFNYWARMKYDLLLPFRSRSPLGCRTLQAGIEDRLGLKLMPTNLAPSSVLESMVGAYAAWSVWAGVLEKDFDYALDEAGYRYMLPKSRPMVKPTPRRRRSRRRF